MPRATERRLCNGRDDTHGPTAAARTASQIDLEHPPQPLHPAHRGAGLDLKRVVSALGRGRRSADDVIAMFGIRGEQTVIAQQMHARARHQGGETRGLSCCRVGSWDTSTRLLAY